MGLPSQEYVTMIARPPKNYHERWRAWELHQALFYWNLSILLFDKGKPRESGGRKAMGLPLRDPRDHDSQAAENKLSVYVPA